jgi:hypothetical protein
VHGSSGSCKEIRGIAWRAMRRSAGQAAGTIVKAKQQTWKEKKMKERSNSRRL